jgi:hypothetical protein
VAAPRSWEPARDVPNPEGGDVAMIDWQEMRPDSVALAAVFRISVVSIAGVLHRIAAVPEQRRHGT